MGVILVFLVWVALFIVTAYGYIHNIVLLVGHVGAFGLLEVVRAVGILAAPLGVIMGFVG
jgi:hypothetical protein